MRSIWKGAVTFGLVNVPVKLYSATEDHDVPLHQVHDADGGRIRYRRVCELDGEEVQYQHIDRAYDDGERTVVLTKDDLAALPAETNREIEVVEFVPSDQIDPIMLDRTYYLEPDSKSPKAYVLLRRTLEETDRTAIVKFALRQRTRLAALRVRDEVLVIQTLLWADEVREAAFPSLDGSVTVSDKELAMSGQLVASYEADFAPEDYEDEYQTQLRTLIDAKIEQGEALDTSETFGEQPEKEDADVIDLMEALRRSVSGSKGGGKGASKEDAPDSAKKAPAKRSTAKEPAAKKASAKKPAAKKAPAKKPAAKKAPSKKAATPERKTG
ncbi:Ku protein [Isoptericola sp. NPDC057191]|uniref:non-homologous end joining protein Ku n=1 Tax=Isoptericola sp. NPDC057191 TaxID=3346041 RepID=UPI0036392B62